jgi:hypothetical protein
VKERGPNVHLPFWGTYTSKAFLENASSSREWWDELSEETPGVAAGQDPGRTKTETNLITSVTTSIIYTTTLLAYSLNK